MKSYITPLIASSAYVAVLSVVLIAISRSTACQACTKDGIKRDFSSTRLPPSEHCCSFRSDDPWLISNLAPRKVQGSPGVVVDFGRKQVVVGRGLAL